MVHALVYIIYKIRPRTNSSGQQLLNSLVDFNERNKYFSTNKICPMISFSPSPDSLGYNRTLCRLDVTIAIVFRFYMVLNFVGIRTRLHTMNLA